MALWWVPKGHIPDVNEGLEKINIIQEKGACADAFTFAKPYGPDKQPNKDAPKIGAPN